MFTFEDYIFNEYFTLYDKVSDPNKDADGKGTHERFNEQIGAEIDEYVMPLTENMQTNLLEPLSCLDRFIPYLESMLGYDLAWLWFFAETLTFRRNLLRIIIHIYQIRGTRWAHEVMFAWMGLYVTIIEVIPEDGTWDDGGRWDDGGTWDTACATCSEYSLVLTGPYVSLTAEQIQAIGTIVEFNRPINATYTGYVYGDIVDPITLWTSPILDLSETSYAITPTTAASTMVFGALFFTFPSQDFYSSGDEVTAVAYYNSLRAARGMTGLFDIVGNDIVYVQGAGEAWTVVQPIVVLPKMMVLELDTPVPDAAAQLWNYFFAGNGSYSVVNWGDGGALNRYNPSTPALNSASHTYADGLTAKTVNVFHNNLLFNSLLLQTVGTAYLVSEVTGVIPASITTLRIVDQKLLATSSVPITGLTGLVELLIVGCAVGAFSPALFGGTFNSLNLIDLSNNTLSSTEVDTVLNDFVGNTPGYVASGTFAVDSQTPAAAPTGASAASISALLADLWLVTTD